MRDRSSYVVETQSRGVGAIATEDLGVTAKTSGSQLLTRVRASNAFAPQAYQTRTGFQLAQPSRQVTINVPFPTQRAGAAITDYDKPATTLQREILVSRPGGAQVVAGQVAGQFTPPQEYPVSTPKGVFSAVHTPQGPTISSAPTLSSSVPFLPSEVDPGPMLPAAVTAAPTKKPNWLLIGGIAGAAVGLYLLTRKKSR